MGELNERHLKDLRSSGLSNDTIAKAGIYSGGAEEIAGILGFNAGDGMVIPYPGTEEDGAAPFRRVKPDRPFTGEDGKPAKYLSPKATKYPKGNRLYIPAMLAAEVLSDTAKPLVITEGEKKALAAVQSGFAAVALSGVTCWVHRNGDGTSGPITDLDRITWRHRQVTIVFDSDTATNEAVRWEEYKLAGELKQRGARCLAARIPPPTEEENEEYRFGGKLGLDDLLVARGEEALKQVLAQAVAPKRPRSKKEKKSGAPQYHQVARQFLHSQRLTSEERLHLRYWRGSFYRWTGTAYEEWPDNDVRSAVMAHLQSRDELQDHCTRNFVVNVTSNLEGICCLPSSTTPPAWLCEPAPSEPTRCVSLANGILDIDALMAGAENALSPHTADYFSMNALPFGFDETARCPLWREVLSRILPEPATQQFLQEWFGYCLLADTSLQRFLLMLGEGANGKSLVCAILSRLLGDENVSAVPIERFRDTHSLVGTLNRLANISSEFEEIDKATEGALKAFVSGDAMDFNPKYKPTFTAVPTARLTVAANNLPRISDKSSGPWRRMVILRFPVQIPEAEQDPKLVEKLEGEMPGILNWSLAGLHRLLARGDFLEPQESLELKNEHRRACNPARMFIEENLTYAPGGQLGKQAVYEEYKGFCRESGYSPCNEVNFSREVYRYFGAKVRSIRVRLTDGVRSYVYDGLKWSSEGNVPGGPGGLGGNEDFPERAASPATVPGGLGGPGDFGNFSRRGEN